MTDACKLFVGNLAYQAKNDDLEDLFKKCGDVEDAVVITDRETGRSRGFGFVTFTNEQDAEKAKQDMHEFEFMGRNITVRDAESKRGGGGGGGRYGGGGYGGGGYGGGGYGGGGRRYEGGSGGGYRGGDFKCAFLFYVASIILVEIT